MLRIGYVDHRRIKVDLLCQSVKLGLIIVSIACSTITIWKGGKAHGSHNNYWLLKAMYM